MPLFNTLNGAFVPISQTNFDSEKQLQTLIEKNLVSAFNCQFVATEFPTGAIHLGRIDTLALSEDNNPVIIEYKNVESSKLVTQTLYYLHWLYDHRGDFVTVARETLGAAVEIDWSAIRVICIAPTYDKFAIHAVEVMKADIELWQYRRFNNGCLLLEQVNTRALAAKPDKDGFANTKDPVMAAAGKKAALTRATASYTFEQHLDGRPEAIRDIALAVQELMTGLDSSIEEAPKKQYVAYKSSQNIVCMEVKKQKIYLYLKLNPKLIANPSPIIRDVTSIGHYGTGDVEVTLRSRSDLETAKPLIHLAFQNIGG